MQFTSVPAERVKRSEWESFKTSLYCPKFAELAKSCPNNAGSGLTDYAVMGRDEVPIIYTENIRRLLDAWGNGAKETSRFADFELAETDDANSNTSRTMIMARSAYRSPSESSRAE